MERACLSFFTIVEISTKIVYWRELISSISEMTDCLFTVGWYDTHHCMVIDDLKNVVEFWPISSKICSVTVVQINSILKTIEKSLSLFWEDILL